MEKRSGDPENPSLALEEKNLAKRLSNSSLSFPKRPTGMVVNSVNTKGFGVHPNSFLAPSHS
ncbi:hypothetical protein Patl1_06851 [Pistacia atlantica]|uniref:Uncharacterized protein n=1 Tax=Pistacia atlantica TaxID=434234 RepID=A0ACC1AGF4_9ROSI|nr:hypothetical protein Patl1_06851 [Pistacia atlantica]